MLQAMLETLRRRFADVSMVAGLVVIVRVVAASDLSFAVRLIGVGCVAWFLFSYLLVRRTGHQRLWIDLVGAVCIYAMGPATTDALQIMPILIGASMANSLHGELRHAFRRAVLLLLARGTFVAAHGLDAYDFALSCVIVLMVTRTWRLILDLIRDRDEMEVRLRHAQKLESVARLSAGVAHELNTPIQFVQDNVAFLAEALQGYEKAIERRAAGPATDAPLSSPIDGGADEQEDLRYFGQEAPRAAEDALQGLERIAAIVQSMKSFGRPDGSDRTAVDIEESVTSAVTMTDHQVAAAASLALDIEPGLWVPGNAADLNHVWLALLQNAAEAVDRTGRRGAVCVTASTEGSEVVVRVVDDGDGVPPENLERIFDPFFTTHDVGGGMGQGLAVAHAVVTSHGGSIEVESTVDAGSTFIVRLPLERAPA